ncbi:hypothetical protein BHM03_00024003 [Ensete ventricosum]|nr:hypothetical protein BHM03_00024003 [Ensete ventricosum]
MTAAEAKATDNSGGSSGQQWWQRLKLRTAAKTADSSSGKAEAPEGIRRWRRNLRSSPSTVEETAHWSDSGRKLQGPSD